MREWVQQACFWGVALCGVLSLWPFPFVRKWKSWNLYLPLAGIGFYGLFEIALPREADVQGKMSLLVALLFFLWLNGMAKVAILKLLQDRARRARRHFRDMPQGLWQVLAAVPIAAGGAVWWWMMWK